MSNLSCMSVPESRNELLEYVPWCFLRELLSLTDKPVELSVLLNFHDIVKYSLNFTVRGTINSSDIKVDYLNNVSMFGLVRHLHLVQELLKGLLLVAPFGMGLFYLLIHYLDRDSLVSHHINSHFDSELGRGTWKNGPIPIWRPPCTYHRWWDTTRDTLEAALACCSLYNNYWYKICYNLISTVPFKTSAKSRTSQKRVRSNEEEFFLLNLGYLNLINFTRWIN